VAPYGFKVAKAFVLDERFRDHARRGSTSRAAGSVANAENASARRMARRE